MKIDYGALVLRCVIAWFLFSLTVLFLYLAGAGQSFLETTLAGLFRFVRWLSWLGVLATWLVLVPLTPKRLKRRMAAALCLGVGFSSLFVFVLVWGSWVYPEAGRLGW